MSTVILDRKYVSQFSTDPAGLFIYVAGALHDADGTVQAVMTNEVTSAVVFNRAATRISVGQYAINFLSTETAAPGLYSINFTYTVNGVADNYTIHIEVGSSSPAYDALPSGMKDVVEQVWVRFADLFDSPYGGPHLQTYVQTNFGRNRLAQLLQQAVGRLNTISQPFMTYSVSNNFPFVQWGPLLVQALYVEVLKHLKRSYVEQPEVLLGTSISRLDRRDYMARWGEILTDETTDLERALSSFKIANMGLGSGSVLVSGGIFGRGGYGWGSTPGLQAARGYLFASRMY